MEIMPTGSRAHSKEAAEQAGGVRASKRQRLAAAVGVVSTSRRGSIVVGHE